MSDNSNLQSPKLPPTWTMTALGAVVAYGRTNKAEPSDMKGTDWVLELEDIEKGSSRLLGRLTFADRQSKSTKNRFEAGDVLYGKLRPYLNKVLIADQPGFCTTEIVPIQPGEHLDARYLFYWLKHPVFLKYVEAESHGMNMPRLGTDAGRAAPFVLAPRAEQTRIADQLDTLLARVNACNDHLDAIPGILKRLRKAMLRYAITGELSREWRDTQPKQIPAWDVVRIKDVGRVQLGRQRAPKFHAGKNMRPYLRVQNVFEARLDLSDVMEMDFPPEDVERYQLHPGDILLNEGQSPEYLGRPAMYKGELPGACFTNTLIRFQAGPSVLPEFALMVFRHHMHSGRYIQEGKITTNLAHLGAGRFADVEFPLPSLDEQREIVRKAEALFSVADSIEARYTAMRAHAQRLAPQVLAKAFRGELVEQDPKDEPASVLLQRLAATTSAKARSSRGRPRAQPQVPATLPAPQAPAPIDWHTLPNNDWAAPAAAQDQAITACLTAVLKAWGQPMPELDARLATLLCQQPRVFTTVLPAAQAKQWVRLVGEEAKPLPAQVARLQPASNSPWGKAIKRMRARGDLAEAGSGVDTTWSLGPGASAIITAGWPDGRAAFVVAHLRAHGVASILPALAPADQAFVHVRAA